MEAKGLLFFLARYRYNATCWPPLLPSGCPVGPKGPLPGGRLPSWCTAAAQAAAKAKRAWGKRAYRDPTTCAARHHDLAAREASSMCPKCLGPTGPLGTRIQAVPLADIAHLRASPARAACEQTCLCATKIASALTFCSMPMNPAAQSPGARHFPADLLDVAGLAAKDQEGRQRGGVGYSRPPTAPNEAAVESNVRLLECPCLPVLGLFVVSPSTSRSTSCSQWDF